MSDSPGPCPFCGSPTDWLPDCPGYPSTWNGKQTIMVCVPCDNATRYFCTNEGCEWSYRIPNNRPDAQGPPPTAWEARDLMAWSAPAPKVVKTFKARVVVLDELKPFIVEGE